MERTESEERARILVVDDATQNIELLRAMLAVAGYDVITASNGDEALVKVQQEAPDLVLLDTMLPKLDGYETCSRLKGSEETRLVPVILITSPGGKDNKLRAFDIGCDDFVERPVNRIELLARVRSLVRAKRLNQELVSLENAIMALAIAIEAKDPYTEGHVERVSRYALSLGRKIGLSHREQELLRKGSILHDVGKIGIRESVLLKQGELNEEEREHIRIHPVVGERICQPLKSRLILDVVRHHHERYDGKGYPDGLAEGNIPLAARIMAIVDAFDALTSERPYRQALSPDEARTVLRGEAGKQFDPELLWAFIDMLESG